MSYYKKLYRFATPYKKEIYLNIFFNVLYALFSTLSLIAVIPVLKVIFNDTKPVLAKPVYSDDLETFKDFSQDYLNYFLTTNMQEHGQFAVLMYIIAFIITIFLLKNLCNYFALYFITHMRNGVIKDLRTELYGKLVRLPFSYYSRTTSFTSKSLIY